jgi:hypothetical protein
MSSSFLLDFVFLLAAFEWYIVTTDNIHTMDLFIKATCQRLHKLTQTTIPSSEVFLANGHRQVKVFFTRFRALTTLPDEPSIPVAILNSSGCQAKRILQARCVRIDIRAGDLSSSLIRSYVRHENGTRRAVQISSAKGLGKKLILF